VVKYWVEQSGQEFDVMCSGQGVDRTKTALDFVLQSVNPEEEPTEGDPRYQV
jgi:hypothetical protein